MTGFAALASAAFDCTKRDFEATASVNRLGAVDDAGLPLTAWIEHYAATTRSLRKFAIGARETRRDLAKMHIPKKQRLAKRFDDPELAKVADALAKAVATLDGIASAAVDELPALDALVKRLDAWLAQPMPLPGYPGVPRHLLNRAVPGSRGWH